MEIDVLGSGLSANLKKRFCKDCNLPVAIYESPYFLSRLGLLDKHYYSLHKWFIFVRSLKNEKYRNEQDYFEDCDRIQTAIIADIILSVGYNNFIAEDMNKFAVENTGFPRADIYKPQNDQRRFISIDIKSANFSALRHYDSTIFAGERTWREFIGKYTDNEHIQNSKYMRQSILGKCNPKRQIAYEKYLMDKVLTAILKVVSRDCVVSLNNDEIVLDVTDAYNKEETDSLIIDFLLNDEISGLKIPLSFEQFQLHKLGNIGYYKQLSDDSIEFKCVSNHMLPFAIAKVEELELTENSKVFYHDGLLAKFIETPEI